LEFTTIKGFKDILPEDVGTWQRLESEARRIFHSFGFKEIRPPLLERTELFSRGIGQETDIVSKEMYTLKDSKGRGLTLRPEATASVARAYIQNRLYQKNSIQKLFTIGPMFRHERPQKGRFRQFHQIDAEIFGVGFPLACDFLKELGYSNFGKPDVHIMKIFKSIGLADKNAGHYQMLKAITRIADHTGESAYAVDKLFWLIGSGYFYNHKHIGRNGRVGSMRAAFIEHVIRS